MVYSPRACKASDVTELTHMQTHRLTGCRFQALCPSIPAPHWSAIGSCTGEADSELKGTRDHSPPMAFRERGGAPRDAKPALDPCAKPQMKGSWIFLGDISIQPGQLMNHSSLL